MICLKPEFGQTLADLATGFDGFAAPEQKVNDLTGYAAFDGDCCVGYLLFKISAVPNITRVSAREAEIGDGLLKAAADFAVRMGAQRITCTDVRDTVLLKDAGFAEQEPGKYGMEPGNVKRKCKNCPF